jgi:hypothetical protein
MGMSILMKSRPLPRKQPSSGQHSDVSALSFSFFAYPLAFRFP